MDHNDIFPPRRWEWCLYRFSDYKKEKTDRVKTDYVRTMKPCL